MRPGKQDLPRRVLGFHLSIPDPLNLVIQGFWFALEEPRALVAGM
jgi:hypothetical protein